MNRTNKKIVSVTLGAVMMVLIFIFDTHTPRGVVDGMLYLPLILLTIFIQGTLFTWLSGILATVLIILGYFYSPQTVDLSTMAVTNRLLVSLCSWIIVILIYIYKRSEKRVLYYKERLSAMFEHVREGILIVNQKENIGLMNPEAEKLFGYAEKELTGTNFRRVLPGLWREDGETPVCPSLAEMTYGQDELLFIACKKDQNKFPATVRVWNFHFSGHTYYIFFVLDVTEKLEQKKKLDTAHAELLAYSAEMQKSNALLEERVEARTLELRHMIEELENLNTLLQREIMNREEAAQALSESQQRLETIAMNFPNGILAVLDKNYKYTYARGREYRSQVGSADELVGKLFMPLENERVSEPIRRLLDRVFNGEKISFEYRDPATDNHYLFNIAPLPGFGGTINQVLAVSQNITALKKAEAEIMKSLEKERELNEMKSRFVSTASHEFRTPLAAIVSSASLIAMYNKPGDEASRNKHVARITSSVSNLTEILNDFLSLGKIEEGKVANQPQDLSIRELFNDITEELTPILKEQQEIVTVFSEVTDLVRLDKQLLRNILTNLLSNAIKYSSAGSTINCSIFQKNGSLTISVADQGIGIPEEDKKHLFGTFFRASNVDSIKGTGMGLHIVKKYLEIMGGKISFESELGKGSTFTVTVPAQPQASLN